MTQRELEKDINSYIKGKRIIHDDKEMIRMVARHYYYFCRKYFARQLRAEYMRCLAIHEKEPDLINTAYWEGKVMACHDAIRTLMADI